MANEIVRHDVTALVDGWLEAERQGGRFPVPFHEVWWIAGHGKKQDAILLAESLLEEGFDFLRSTVKTSNVKGGRPVKAMHLTLAGLEHVCMAAHTEQGRQVRELYRIAKRNWDEVKRVDPNLAAQIELERIKQETVKMEQEKIRLEESRDKSSLALIQFRHIVTTTMPETLQQKILGYETVERVEYRDRIIAGDEIVNDGSTVLKWELCRRYGLLTKTGKPNYKALNRLLEELPPEAFTTSVRFQENNELRREWIPAVDRIFQDSDRNLFTGE